MNFTTMTDDELNRYLAEHPKVMGWIGVEPPDEGCGWWEKVSDKHLGRRCVMGFNQFNPTTDLNHTALCYRALSEEGKHKTQYKLCETGIDIFDAILAEDGPRKLSEAIAQAGKG